MQAHSIPKIGGQNHLALFGIVLVIGLGVSGYVVYHLVSSVHALSLAVAVPQHSANRAFHTGIDLHSDCLAVVGEKLKKLDSGSATTLVGLKLVNLCNTTVVVDKMCLWTADKNRKLREVKAGGEVVYRGAFPGSDISQATNDPSVFELSDLSLEARQEISLDAIQFQRTLTPMSLGGCFVMSDGSRKTIQIADQG